MTASKVILGAPTTGATSHGAHQLESLLRCEKEFQFSQVRKIREPSSETPDHFAVGLLFHAARARWFSLNFDSSQKAQASVEQAIREEAERQKLPVSVKAERSTSNLFSAYVEHWLTRTKPKPLAAEYTLGPVELFPGEPSSVRTARLDDASKYEESGGLLALGECKTTSTDISDTINQYTLHLQPMLQAALWHAAPNGEKKYGPVSGVVLDVVRKAYGKEKPKFARQFVPVTATAMAWFMLNIRLQTKRASEITWDSEVSRNINSCTRVYGRMRKACDFRDICVHGKGPSVKFVLENGESLMSHKPMPGKMKMPWL